LLYGATGRPSRSLQVNRHFFQRAGELERHPIRIALNDRRVGVRADVERSGLAGVPVGHVVVLPIAASRSRIGGVIGPPKGLLAPKPSTPRGHSPPSASRASVIKAQPKSRGTLAPPPSPSAAGTNTGCPDACSAPSSCAKPSWRGPSSPSRTVTGPWSMIGDNAPGAPPTRPRYAPWPSRGFESCSAAGRSASPTTRRPPSTRSSAAARRRSRDSETLN
jgi:hypothetical protein